MSQQLQLTLLETNVIPSFTPDEAYDIVSSAKRPQWTTMLEAVSVLEPSLKKQNYPKQFKNSSELINSLVNIDYYIAALKAVWWNRLIFLDRDINFLNYEDVKLNTFLRVFSIAKFGKKTKQIQINRGRVPVARFHYKTACSLNGNTSKDLWTYAENYRQLEITKEIKMLEQKVSQLEWELFDAKQGILTYGKYRSKNLEISPKYLELYVEAKQTKMNSIQHSVFLDTLFFQGFYAACQYLSKFEQYENL